MFNENPHVFEMALGVCTRSKQLLPIAGCLSRVHSTAEQNGRDIYKIIEERREACVAAAPIYKASNMVSLNFHEKTTHTIISPFVAAAITNCNMFLPTECIHRENKESP